MGGVANTVKKAASNPLRTALDIGSFGSYELARKALPGVARPFEQGVQSLTGQRNNGEPAAIPGPFTLDAGQFEGDRSAINQEGQKQYDATLAGLGDVSKANTKRASDLFGQMLPDIAENAQAAHLYDSTGYGQEVARQQSGIASQVANEEAQQKQAALGGLQGFQTGALQRGLGLEDFVNQANVAKTIGAQMAPTPPSSKATGFSRGVAGAGAGAQIGGPWGAGAGALAGLASGGK